MLQMYNGIDESAVEEKVKLIQRDINCIIDEDRNTRRQGLNKINDFFKGSETPSIKLFIFDKYIVKNILKAFDDQIQKNRELSYTIYANYLKCSNAFNQDILDNVLKVLIQRVNTIPYLENCEELRLQVIKLIQTTLNKQPDAFKSKLPEYANMLNKTLQDEFPDMKKVLKLVFIISKQTSMLIMDTSRLLGSLIGGYMVNVVKSIASNMGHQHFRVRKVAVEVLCLSYAILCEGAGPFLEHALQPLRKLTQDKSSDVRKTCFNTISQMLQHLSVANLNIFENDLLLLLLNGLSDENKEIQQITSGMLEQVGQRREKLDEEIGQM